jgi:hypothetical protein
MAFRDINAPRFVLSPDGDVIDEYSGEAVYTWFPDQRMPFTVDGLTGEAALERLARGKAAIKARSSNQQHTEGAHGRNQPE